VPGARALDIEGSPLLALGVFDPRRAEDGVHDLVRRFKAGDAAALVEVAARARAAVEASGDLAARRLFVVPVPGHLPGPDESPGLALAIELARVFPWVVPDPLPLRRIAPMPPAKDGGARDPGHEEATLAWDDAGLRPAGWTVLLLDDVIASGRTLEACLAAIRRDGSGGRPVRVLALARAATGIDPSRESGGS